MAEKIRLTRMGDNKTPFYRLVAADSRSARDGKVIENLGTYNPLTTPSTLEFNKERIAYWLSVGAVPTETAKELLTREGVIEKVVYKPARVKKMPPAKKEAEKTEETPAEKVEEAPAE